MNFAELLPLRNQEIRCKQCKLPRCRQKVASEILLVPGSALPFLEHVVIKMTPSKEEQPSGSSTVKIPMKGFSLSAKSSSSSSKLAATGKPNSSILGKRGRSTFARDDDSDSGREYDNDGRNSGGRHEVVTGFSGSGAIRAQDEKPKQPLVIPTMKNRDWRGEARVKRGKNLLPPEVQAAREAAARQGGGEVPKPVDVVNGNDGEIRWGLTVTRREKVESNEKSLSDSAVKGLEEAGTGDAGTNNNPDNGTNQEQANKEKTDDELALEALMGISSKPKGPELVISVAEDDRDTGPISEQDAYRRAIQTAPDVSTLEDYERVPVEEFGAALLRGMGWNGEKKEGAKEVKRRQNLLGLGAKELKDAEELGAWVQKSDVKRLNVNGNGSRGQGNRRPKVNEYRREKEKREERRDERHGGGYRREREREDYRERDKDRNRDRRY